MSFSKLLEKMVNGETLSPGEKQQLVLDARHLEDTASFMASLVKPGTKVLVVDGLEAFNAVIENARILRAVAGSGDEVILDNDGVFIKNSVDAWFNFEDAQGNRGTINIAVDPNNDFEFVNLATDGTMSWFLGTFANRDRVMRLSGSEDTGYRWELCDGTSDALVDLRTEGASSGSTFIRLRETTRTPPVGGSDAFHMYIKDDKLIIQFTDGATTRYKYLDLTGTGVTWQHTTTAP